MSMIAGFAGNVIGPDHPEYDEVRPGWNGMIDRKPALIAQCTSTADVVAAVKHAAANGLTAVARCGGHSVSGASLPEGGVLVDLTGLRSITVDPEARIAHVAGGCLLGDLDAATQEHGLAVTAGIEPSTGAGGLTLGGGIGFLCRKLGLTIDNLASMEVVLADGSVVTASADEHPDLFWALRGGGGQFGIVTRFDYRVHPIGPEVMVAQAYYPMDDAKAALTWLRDYMHSASEDLGLATSFLRVPPIDPFPEEAHGKPCLALIASHVGEADEARKALQPFLEQGEMLFGFVDPMPYVDFQRCLADGSPHGNRYYWKSHFIHDLSDEVIDIMVEAARDFPGEFSQIFTEGLGGAVSQVGADETAFANRSARYNLGISCGRIDPALDDEAISRTRALFDAIAPHADKGVYINYLDRDEIDRAAELFGPKTARLTSIKAKYDPANLFGGPLGGAG